MIVAIKAYEGIYQGLHGILSRRVIECENEEDAEEWAVSDSIDVMYSYSIMEEFITAAQEEGLEEDTEEWNEYIEECISNNIGYEIYEVTKNIKSLEELDKEFDNDPCGFIKNHTDLEIKQGLRS